MRWETIATSIVNPLSTRILLPKEAVSSPLEVAEVQAGKRLFPRLVKMTNKRLKLKYISNLMSNMIIQCIRAARINREKLTITFLQN